MKQHINYKKILITACVAGLTVSSVPAAEFTETSVNPAMIVSNNSFNLQSKNVFKEYNSVTFNKPISNNTFLINGSLSNIFEEVSISSEIKSGQLSLIKQPKVIFTNLSTTIQLGQKLSFSLEDVRMEDLKNVTYAWGKDGAFDELQQVTAEELEFNKLEAGFYKLKIVVELNNGMSFEFLTPSIAHQIDSLGQIIYPSNYTLFAESMNLEFEVYNISKGARFEIHIVTNEGEEFVKTISALDSLIAQDGAKSRYKTTIPASNLPKNFTLKVLII